MQTRREQLQAYQFLVRRILAALLGNEPEAPEQPMRRAKVATFSGIMVGALACGGVALVGFLTHSSSQGWQDSTDAIIVDKTTKQKFFYQKGDGGRMTLSPIVNYTSAQLLLENSEPQLKEVPPENLAGVPRGPAVGIPGIPDALPAAASVTDGPWLACNHMPTAKSRLVDLFVDHEPPKGASPVGEDGAVLIEDENGEQLYMVWGGQRLALDEQTRTHLGMQRVEPIRVRDAWLNLLPQGSDLEPIPIEGAGDTTQMAIKNETLVVGQVLESVNSVDPYWLVYPDGVAPITETQANLIVKDPVITGQTGQADFTAISDADLPPESATDPAIPADQPDKLPRPVQADSTTAPLCVTYDGDPDELRVSVGGQMPRSNALQAVGGQATGLAANRVTVTGGMAAVISPLGANGEPSGYAIVADSGLKYPVPSKTELGYVGYGSVSVLQVPKPFADLIQAGPALNADLAGRSALQQSGN